MKLKLQLVDIMCTYFNVLIDMCIYVQAIIIGNEAH